MRLTNYRPNVFGINPTDSAALDLLKITDGHHIRVETERIPRTPQPVETTEVPAGYMLLIDTTKQIVRPYENLRIEARWENDDFRKNLVRIIAGLRLHGNRNPAIMARFFTANFTPD